MIFAIECSSDYLSLAVLKDSRIIAGFKSKTRFKAEDVSVFTERLFKSRALSLKRIDLLAIGLGPGSFTGLRVGVASAKALELALDVPVIGIGSLDIMAAAVEAKQEIDVCPLIDAKRGNVYTAVFEKKPKTIALKKKISYSLIKPQQLLKLIKKPTVFLGDGLKVYGQFLSKSLNSRCYFLAEKYWYPEAKTLALMADSLDEKTKKRLIKKPLLPLYLYPKECQIIR